VVEDLSLLLSEPDFSGAVIGLVDGSNQGLACLGYADLSKKSAVTEHTLFEIGSISKVFTGILLEHAIEDGRFSLDDKLSDLLKEKGDFSNFENVTLKDLVTHHSGLPKVMDSPMAILKTAYLFYMNKNPYGYYTTERVLNYLQEVDVESDYGSYKYSNIGVGLVGYLLAQSYNESYENLIRRYILSPYRMVDSCVLVPDSRKSSFAVGYSSVNQILGQDNVDYKESPYWDLPEIIVGAGGIRSSGADMLLFLEECLRGNDPALNASLDVLVPGKLDMAMCWHVLEVEDTRVYFHNGATGGFFSYLIFNREKQIGLFILFNSQKSPDAIAQILLKELLKTNPAINNSGY